MYRTFQILILIILCFILISCGPKPSKVPEGNIDVDKEIYIIPIGDDVDEKYLHSLIPKLERRFTTKVHVALDKRFPDPDHAYDYDQKKHVAMYILSDLIKVELPENSVVLGVCNVDIFVPESNYPFAFGQAQYGKNSKGAIISMLRMDPKSYVRGKANDELLIQRMQKTAIRQLGYVFGLRSSADPECVMYAPKDLDELDKQSDSFCIECQKYYREISKSRREETKNK